MGGGRGRGKGGCTGVSVGSVNNNYLQHTIIVLCLLNIRPFIPWKPVLAAVRHSIPTFTKNLFANGINNNGTHLSYHAI